MQLKSWQLYTNTKQPSMKILGQTLERKDLVHLIPRLLVVVIIGQTLPFKYSGAEESVWIFSQMGWEPWGRYLIAIIETTAILFLLSRYYIFGAIITLSIIVIICSLIVVIHWNRKRSKNYDKHFDYEVHVEEEAELDS